MHDHANGYYSLPFNIIQNKGCHYYPPDGGIVNTASTPFTRLYVRMPRGGNLIVLV